jgi:hypothetical protein
MFIILLKYKKIIFLMNYNIILNILLFILKLEKYNLKNKNILFKNINELNFFREY